MKASTTELRELADLLDKFAGIKATEWTPGAQWVLKFNTQGVTHHQTLCLVEVLNVLLTNGVKVLNIRQQTLGPTVYTISAGDVARLMRELQHAEKNLWRLAGR
jgi:hypothetical protein